MKSMTEQLRGGKQIKFKHTQYQFTITATLRLENDEVTVQNVKIGLPVKASKGEKLLLKYVQIYCYDILRNNLYADIVASFPYRKALASYNQERINGNSTSGRRMAVFAE